MIQYMKYEVSSRVNEFLKLSGLYHDVIQAGDHFD